MDPCFEPDVVRFPKGEWLVTKFGNKISKRANLPGMTNIAVRGKAVIEAGVTIRGDLAVVNIGQHSIIGENVTIQPVEQIVKGSTVYIPIVIGDSCIIERDAVVEAASIGSFVRIGRGAKIGKRCVISNCCEIEPNAVLAPGTVVAPFSVFGGSPAVQVRKLPESYQLTMSELTVSFINNFQPAE